MATPSVNEFDYIMLTIHDIHGLPRGRMVSKKRMPAIIEHGLGVNKGLCFCSILGGEVEYHEDFDERSKYGYKVLKPLLHTLRCYPTFGQGKFKVGQMFCRMEYTDGTLDTSTPLAAAENQLEILRNELGLTVKSAFEIEFLIRETESKQSYAHVGFYSTTSVLEDCQGLLFDMIKELHCRGVPVDSVQTENGRGQFEITLDVTEGLQSIHNTTEFKNIVKGFMKSRGYDATFMTTMDSTKDECCTFHFNHSLWTLSGKNALLDESKPNKLSDLGRHWLAGLIEHAPAMTAFCRPTVNCYRAAHVTHVPFQGDWSKGHSSAFRLKLEGEDNVYIEDRCPMSACNPYLILISTLAAGIDGVRRKLPLPKAYESKCRLPTDLESALQALEADTLLTNAMGKKLVEYFCFCKRRFEVQEFSAAEDLSEEAVLKMEHEYYYHKA